MGNGLLHVWRTEPTADRWLGVPGQVARIIGDTAQVICGDGCCLTLREVSRGADRSAAAEAIRSVRVRFPSRPVYLGDFPAVAPSLDLSAKDLAYGGR
jgi:hypothetical protein